MKGVVISAVRSVLTGVGRTLPGLITRTFSKGYSKYVWEQLPEKSGTDALANGVEVSRSDARFLGSVFGDPAYEYYSAWKLREHVTPGDDVVVVGGGFGVTATIAADQAGSAGTVWCYEAGRRTYDELKDTLERNGVSDIVDAQHAVVAEPGAKLRSDSERVAAVSPSALPEMDVLEIDCEGAELEVVSGLDTRPNVLIVEGHAHYGVAMSELIELIEEKGLTVTETAGNPEAVYHVMAESHE